MSDKVTLQESDAISVSSGVPTGTRFGYLAFLGCPNAGKSTLMNACVGQKIAGVSSKPQTTRNKIVGLIQGDQTQIAILDTPGLHRRPSTESSGTEKLSKYMNAQAWGAAAEADLVCYLIDATKGPTAADRDYLGNLLKERPGKVDVLLSKVDKLRKPERALAFGRLVQWLEALQKERGIEIGPRRVDEISAKDPVAVDAFIGTVCSAMPEGNHLYDSNRVTDRSPAFICSEMIREQIFRLLGQEIPYGTAVSVDSIETKGLIRFVSGTIIVPKEAHKGMVIGARGQKLREIGSASRVSLEKYFGGQVCLKLFVKVQRGWMARPDMIDDLVGQSTV